VELEDDGVDYCYWLFCIYYYISVNDWGWGNIEEGIEVVMLLVLVVEEDYYY
jgi:hypothetical protein